MVYALHHINPQVETGQVYLLTTWIRLDVKD